MKQRFKPQIFVCPADPESNKNIAEHPSLIQVDPCVNVNCYFGRNKIILSLFPVDNVTFEVFKKSRALAFYAFTQSTKDGNKFTGVIMSSKLYIKFNVMFFHYLYFP
jgi:hypothetical protein